VSSNEQSSDPGEKGIHRDKEFSYGKQSLEVGCFYSGPFFFPALFISSPSPDIYKTEIREQVADSASYM
jgi:hypothetical protein